MGARQRGGEGRGRFCWEAADFSISCLSVKEPRGRGHPASLGESPDLQPLAFLQSPPEFGGEGVDKAECLPTAGVVRLDGAPLQEQVGAEPGGIPPHPHHSSHPTGCHPQVHLSPHALPIVFSGRSHSSTINPGWAGPIVCTQPFTF